MRVRTDMPPYASGDVIGRVYRIVRVLAEGGFSVIYEAIDVTVGRTVAVKVLRPNIARMRSYSREQMRRECQVLVKLHEITPYVVDVLTAGITEDQHVLPYYVMERLHGSTLRQSVVDKQHRAEPYTVEEVLSFGITIGMALVRAHGLDVAHRDLKPENVFMALDHGGLVVLKLLDFGMCIDVAVENDMSEQARFTCSLPYAAPEQIEGRRATTATDIYALGLMLIELLTLRLPHGRDLPGLTPERLELALVDEPLPDLSALRPDTPVRLARLLARCLAATPGSRPSAHDVAKELRDTKLQMEGKLDSQEASTDVDEPSIAELHRRMEAASRGKAAEARVVAGQAPVDLHAATEPPPPPEGREEVFFVREVRSARSVAPATPVPPSQGPAAPVASARGTSPFEACDVTLPDPMPPFAARPALPPDRTQPMAILPMPVIEIRDVPERVRTEPEGRSGSDKLYVDPDRALAMLGHPLPWPAWSHTPAPSPFRSEPGPWLTPAPTPPRRRSRDRIVLVLAFASPILIGLSVAPLVFRAQRAPGQVANTAPSSIPVATTPPSGHVTSPAAPHEVGAPSASGTPPTLPRPSPRVSEPKPRPPKPAEGAPGRPDIRQELDKDEEVLFPGKP